MQYTETQLTKLIEDVEKEFTAHLTKAESVDLSLSKAEDDKKPKPEEKEAKPEAEPEASKPEGSEAKPEEHAKPEGESSAPLAPAPEATQGMDGHDYDAEDLAHLEKMYMSMSKGELKAHHDACRAALDSKGMEKCENTSSGMMGKSEIKDENPTLNSKPTDKGEQLFNDKQNGGIEGYQPHDALGAKSPASDANGAKINKSECDRRNGGKQEEQAPGKTPGAKSPASKADGDQMNKSENTEVELLKSELSTTSAKYDELKKNYDGVAAFLSKLLEKKTAPAAKAITSLDVIAKSEDVEGEKTLTKNEVHDILCKKSSEPSLKKSDREAINTYYLKGQVDVTGISHLLK